MKILSGLMDVARVGEVAGAGGKIREFLSEVGGSSKTTAENVDEVDEYCATFDHEASLVYIEMRERYTLGMPFPYGGGRYLPGDLNSLKAFLADSYKHFQKAEEEEKRRSYFRDFFLCRSAEERDAEVRNFNKGAARIGFDRITAQAEDFVASPAYAAWVAQINARRARSGRPPIAP